MERDGQGLNPCWLCDLGTGINPLWTSGHLPGNGYTNTYTSSAPSGEWICQCISQNKDEHQGGEGNAVDSCTKLKHAPKTKDRQF